MSRRDNSSKNGFASRASKDDLAGRRPPSGFASRAARGAYHSGRLGFVLGRAARHVGRGLAPAVFTPVSRSPLARSAAHITADAPARQLQITARSSPKSEQNKAHRRRQRRRSDPPVYPKFSLAAFVRSKRGKAHRRRQRRRSDPTPRQASRSNAASRRLWRKHVFYRFLYPVAPPISASITCPMPVATLSSGFFATSTRMPVTCEMSCGSPEISAPPPVITIPIS